MFCKNCGKQLNDGVKFCSGCGTKTETVSIEQNNITEVETKETGKCNGCLLNNLNKCTYYDCTILEAENYNCNMRGNLELQKKHKNSNTIRFIIILVCFFLFGWFLNPFDRIGAMLGINRWIVFIVFILIIGWIEHLLNKNKYKKRRENAKHI